VIDYDSSVEHYPSDKEIKVGYIRTDGENSIGSGIIGELILELTGTNNVRTDANPCIINLEAVNMGTIQNSSNQTLLQNQQLQVNLCEGTCQTNWFIDETQFQNEFKSTNLIETDGYLIIGEDQQVEYQSNRVCLRPGFKVKAGATFKAGNGGCD